MNAVARFDDYADARPLPQAIDAEQSVLGGLMIDPRAFAKVSDWLHAEDFAKAEHRLIFKAIAGLIERGSPVDAVTLGDWFEDNGMADGFGGPGYLYDLSNNTPSAANIVAYAEIVVEKSRLRKLLDAGQRMASAAVAPGANPQHIAGTAAHELAQMQVATTRGGLATAKESMNRFYAEFMERYRNKAPLLGIPTPWHEVNSRTKGLRDGVFYVVGARPSMGKSVFGLQLAGFASIHDHRTALFSVEMTEQECMGRMAACFGCIPHEWVEQPDDELADSEDYWNRFTPTTTKLRESPLLIDATPGLTVEQFMARARRAHLQKPLRLIVLDHMHDMGLDRKAETRHEYGRIAQAGKTLAKEFNCPVVFLAQLNRAAATRAEKRPTMTDLRESGEIEQKADVILFLHRQDYYTPGDMPGVVEVIPAKGRNIRTGETIHLRNRFDQMRLEDWEGALPEPVVTGPQKSRGFGAPV
ncbi:replicative DNA helicase [Frateuria sp. GZRR33]|uniref:replicative DNA helicase n=1 Tax=Frateuria sp. GZRR33 TaxID=3351535 RepID=UPI003EDC0568